MVRKVVILAGGYGSRLSEETNIKPKPMVEIGSKPILWHIMKIYSAYNINEFIICLGYKGYLIKEFFANYYLHTSDITFNLKTNTAEIHHQHTEPWRVSLIDTGEDVMTGGRLLRVRDYVEDKDFCLTYGDGVGNVNIKQLIDFHYEEKRVATVTAVRPMARFGAIIPDGNKVGKFEEKPLGDGAWVSGGFFVLSPEIFSLIEGDATHWEREPMQQLVQQGELSLYKHTGFWHPMDTLRDKCYLEKLWLEGQAPWKIWD